MPPKDVQPAPVNTMVVANPPRGNLLKKVLIWAGIVLSVVLLILVAVKLFSSKISSGGDITWWGLWEDNNTIQPLIDEYQSSHPGTKIKYVLQDPQDYRERLTSSLAKGTGPDIFMLHNSWAPMFRNDLDSLPASVMSPADFAKTFYPIVSSDLTLGASIVGIPLEYDALTLYINQDIFDKAGAVPPTTWDALRELATKLTIKSEDGRILQSGVALGRTENVDSWPEILALLMIQNGVNLAKPDTCVGEVCPGVDALNFYTYFAGEDGVWDETLPSSTQAFAAGKLAMFIGPSWRAHEILAINKDLKFKTVSIPQVAKNNPNEKDITYATYWFQGVWSRSASKAAAWDFLKFLSSQDSLQKLYKNESDTRAFGEPYPRIDMANLLSDHPVIGSIIKQAPVAHSWFLASRTFDGPTGINSQLNKYYEDAINAVITGGKNTKEALATVTEGVNQVLSQYRLVTR